MNQRFNKLSDVRLNVDMLDIGQDALEVRLILKDLDFENVNLSEEPGWWAMDRVQYIYRTRHLHTSSEVDEEEAKALVEAAVQILLEFGLVVRGLPKNPFFEFLVKYVPFGERSKDLRRRCEVVYEVLDELTGRTNGSHAVGAQDVFDRIMALRDGTQLRPMSVHASEANWLWSLRGIEIILRLLHQQCVIKKCYSLQRHTMTPDQEKILQTTHYYSVPERVEKIPETPETKAALSELLAANKDQKLSPSIRGYHVLQEAVLTAVVDSNSNFVSSVDRLIRMRRSAERNLKQLEKEPKKMTTPLPARRKLYSSEIKIMDVLRSSGGRFITVEDIMTRLPDKLSQKYVINILGRLVNMSLVARSGRSYGARDREINPTSTIPRDVLLRTFAESPATKEGHRLAQIAIHELSDTECAALVQEIDRAQVRGEQVKMAVKNKKEGVKIHKIDLSESIEGPVDLPHQNPDELPFAEKEPWPKDHYGKYVVSDSVMNPRLSKSTLAKNKRALRSFLDMGED